MRALPLLALLAACNAAPSEADLASAGQVGYRDGEGDTTNSGERGCVKISEVLWTGSMTDAGVLQKDDVFVELRNECDRPLNISHWLLELSGSIDRSWRIPGPPDGQAPRVIDVGEHAFIARRSDGCFPDPDWVIPTLELPFGDALRLTLLDQDERLIEPAGSRSMPPFAGGYDGVSVRAMERLEIMFGGRGDEPSSWHFYTNAPVDVANNDRVAASCRQRTLASPGRPNSPDYSGAFAAGSFE